MPGLFGLGTVLTKTEQERQNNIRSLRAQLECGAPTDSTLSRRERLNAYAASNFCMEKSGYHGEVVSGGFFPGWSFSQSARGWCQLHTKDNLPACQPGAPVPVRSAERRLKSDYCKSSIRDGGRNANYDFICRQ